MPKERFYIDAELEIGQTYFLEDQEFHHLIHVMRAKEGDALELVNGRGYLADSTFERLEKKRATCRVTNLTSEPRNAREIILAQALPRIHRLDFIVEKGTELGMTALWLFPGERSERKDLTEAQLERAKTQAIAALKQCGRLWLPEIVLKPRLKEWGSLPFKTFYGDVAPDAPLLATTGESVLFFVGPESGFSQAEEDKLKGMKAQGVKLHPNILRTDTAALVALAKLT